MSNKVFKIVIVGDAKTGKTSYVNRLNNTEFVNKYIPTMGIEVSPLEFKTQNGSCTLNLWDCAGKEEFLDVGQGYCKNAHAAIIFFSYTDPDSIRSVTGWYRDLREILGHGIPIIVCGNKWDEPYRNKCSFQPNIKGDMYCNISAKRCDNIMEPIQYILHKLC